MQIFNTYKKIFCLPINQFPCTFFNKINYDKLLKLKVTFTSFQGFITWIIIEIIFILIFQMVLSKILLWWCHEYCNESPFGCLHILCTGRQRLPTHRQDIEAGVAAQGCQGTATSHRCTTLCQSNSFQEAQAVYRSKVTELKTYNIRILIWIFLGVPKDQFGWLCVIMSNQL